MWFGSSDRVSGRVKNVQQCRPNSKAQQHLTAIADKPLRNRGGEAYDASLIKAHNPSSEMAVTMICDVVYDHFLK